MPGCVCPHPPLLVPAIGREQRSAVSSTIAAMDRLGRAAGERETVVVISPHTTGYSGNFTVKAPATLWGDFSAFNCPQVGLEVANDAELVQRLQEAAGDVGLALEPIDDDYLDHGILVPMTFLKTRHLVSLSIVVDYDVHRTIGDLVRRCADELGRDVLFLASGDLSHRLIPSAPAGYSVRAAEFDQQVVALLERGDFEGLDRLDDGLVRAAGECGLRSFIALGGFLGEAATDRPALLSYEGPFGVGYAVAAYGLDLS